jgi:hypothetical protein
MMSYSLATSAPRRRFPVIAPTLVILLGLLVSGCGLNRIPTYEEQAKAKWSEVENQYQRRSDLIPNLVETVKGYAKQEREVLQAVTEARSRATTIQAAPELINNPDAFKKFQDAQLQLSGGAARLHRGGAALQHRAQDLSGRVLGEATLRQPQADGGIHRRRGREAQPASQALTLRSHAGLRS